MSVDPIARGIAAKALSIGANGVPGPTGATGPQGPAGPTGPTGATGPAGTIVNYVNVRSAPYNATGNGTTDDTAAFRSAVTAALAGSGALYVPSGVYLVSDPGLTGAAITISGGSSPLTLFGDGPSSQILMTSSSSTAPNGTCVFICYSPTFISNLYVNGNTLLRARFSAPTTGGGVGVYFAQGSNGSVLKNCVVSAPGFQSVAVTGYNSTVTSDVTIQNNVIYGGNDTGIDLDGSITNISVTGNTIFGYYDASGTSGENFTKYGIAIDYNQGGVSTANCNITGNSIFVVSPPIGSLGGQAPPVGILVQGCNNNIISNNTINCNGGTGIYLTSGAAYNQITHNTIALTNSAIDNGFGIDLQAGGYNSSFTASMSGTTMTLTSAVSGNALAVGYQVVGLNIAQSTILSVASGSGGVGTVYNMSVNQSVSSETMYATYEGLADKVSNTIAFNDIYATFLSVQSGLHAYHTGATFIKNHVRGFGNTSGQGGSGILCENLTNTLQPSTAFTWNIVGNEISDNRTGYIFHVQASAGTNNGGPCTALMLSNQDYNSTYASMQTYDGTNGYVWPGNALPGQMTLQAMGTATLVAGSVTISDGSVTPLSKINIRVLTPAGTQGALYVNAQSNGSFTVKSSSSSDTSTIVYTFS